MKNSNQPLSRRIARETAFRALYGMYAVGEERATKASFFDLCSSLELEHDEFTWELVSGVRQNLPEIDEKLKALAANWRIERMPYVDRTILELGAYEILFRSDIPKSVAINEAVELAKAYGEADSPAFINGVLDKLSKPT